MRRSITLAVLAFGAAACAGPAAMHPLAAQHATMQCPLASADPAQALLVLDNERQWAGALRADEAATFGRAVRWAEERVVVFALAQQPTLGTRVALDKPQAELRQGVLQLTLRIERPPADAMTATALSRPCVIVAVAREGWLQARAIDTDGATLAAASADPAASPGRGSVPAVPDLSGVVSPAASGIR